MEYAGKQPPFDLDLTARILGHGVGSVILYEDSDWMHRNMAILMAGELLTERKTNSYAMLSPKIIPLRLWCDERINRLKPFMGSFRNIQKNA